MESTERWHLTDEGVGYLTMQEFNRARWAYDYAIPFGAWLRIAGYVNFSAEDVRVHASREGHIGIPATKLAYLEITRLLEELNGWAGIEEAAGDKFGASLCLDIGREMQTAVHRWPMEDKPHKITVMRCGGCEQLTLMYRPPRFDGDLIKVDCAERCGYELSEEEFAWAVTILEKEERERQSLDRSARGTKASA